MLSTSSVWTTAALLTAFVPTLFEAAFPARALGQTPSTEEVIARMLEAHGGYERWANAPTVSFDNVFFNPSTPPDANPWWVSHQVIDQATRRVYQFWPHSGGEMAYDGERVWARNWTIGNYPTFETYFFYFFVNLPWITQDENVRLGEVGTGRLPGIDEDLYTVRMEFTSSSGPGKSDKDAFELFIDPESGLLRGYRYWVGWGPMLDGLGVPEGKLFGPMVRVHKSFQEFDGVLIPTRFQTMSADGANIYGQHLILNYSLSAAFDESKLTMPSDALVDPRTDHRDPGR